MKFDYYIAIPTRGRANKQSTLKQLCPELRQFVNIYCHPGELSLFDEWRNQVASVQEYDPECKNIGDVRDYIIFNSNAKNVIFIDDNIRFQSSIRPKDSVLKGSVFEMIEKNYSKEQILQMQMDIFSWIFDRLKFYAMAGLSFRPANRGNIRGDKVNSRLFGIWGINVEKYLSQDVRFMDWRLKEDFAVAISLIKNGYDTVCNYDYAFEKSSGSNSQGGCSNYRTIELNNEIAFRLKDTFPDCVSIKSKKSRKSWSGEFFEKESMDVIIHWSKIRKNES